MTNRLIAIVWCVLMWFMLAMLNAGFLNADARGTFRNYRYICNEEHGRRNLSISIGLSLIPVSWIVTPFVTGFYQYGWTLEADAWGQCLKEDRMINRRGVLFGIACVAASPGLMTEPSFVINPWAGEKGIVRLSEIKSAQLIEFSDGMNCWFSVDKHDGSFVQTELSQHQPNHMELAKQVRFYGVPVTIRHSVVLSYAA